MTTNFNTNFTPLTDEDTIKFGKYKGTKLKDVPDEYLNWLYENNATFGALKAYLDDNIDAIRQNLRKL